MYRCEEAMPDVNGSGGLLVRELIPSADGKRFTLVASYPNGRWDTFVHPRKLLESEAMEMVKRDNFLQVSNDQA